MTPRPPDFFIVGAPKCGTTALYEYLKTHPGIYMPEEKEPHFFSADLPSRNLGRYKHLPDYLRLFAPASPRQTLGEASVFYLYSTVAIRHIIEVNPKAKFIAMVRNPVEMAHSLHSELLCSFEEDVADFEIAWGLQKERLAGRRIPPACQEPRLLQYRDVCSLAGQLKRLLSVAPASQCLFLVLDDLRTKPRAVYQSVLDFLELPDDGRTTFEPINSNKTLRNPFIARILVETRRQLGAAYVPLRRGLHRMKLRPFKYLWGFSMATMAREPLRPDFKVELQEAFYEEIKSLEELLGRSFSHWLHPESPTMKGSVRL